MKVLVTGGASGLGLSITKKFLEAGNQVTFTYSSSKESAYKLTQESGNAVSSYCNFEDSKSVSGFISSVESQSFDLLVNNAWKSSRPTRFAEIDHDLFLENFTTNLIGTIRITKKMLEIFKAKKSGKIITILSAYLEGTPPLGFSEYVASKGYLASLVKSWANENAKFNIASNAVSPSLFLSGMTKDVDQRVLDSIASSSPGGRLVTVEEIANFVISLVDLPNNISGENFLINGGSHVV